MQSLEEVHANIEELKLEKREIMKMLKDEITQHDRHRELTDELKTMRDEKKSIENDILANSSGDKQRLDEIKSELAAYNELLSDLALNKFMKDETVEIIDKYDNKLVPFFSVKFKKAD